MPKNRDRGPEKAVSGTLYFDARHRFLNTNPEFSSFPDTPPVVLYRAQSRLRPARAIGQGRSGALTLG
jgi:hypothetical protein